MIIKFYTFFGLNMHVYCIGPIKSTFLYGDKLYNLWFTAQKVATQNFELVWALNILEHVKDWLIFFLPFCVHESKLFSNS